MLSTADADSSVAINTKLIPVDQDNFPIKYHSNPAHIDGALHEFRSWMERSGTHLELFENRCTPLSNGKLALDHSSSTPFIDGSINLLITYDFENPCPPGLERLKQHNDLLATADRLDPHTRVKEDGESSIVSLTSIKGALRDLSTSLLAMYADSGDALKMGEEASNDGFEVLRLMREHGKTASAGDRVFVRSTVDKFIAAGIAGEVTLKSFKHHLKELRRQNRFLAVADRKQDADFIQVINGVMYRDKGVREQFENMLLIVPDPSLTVLETMILKFLRTRNVNQDIDDVHSGLVKQAALGAVHASGAVQLLRNALVANDSRTLTHMLRNDAVTPEQAACCFREHRAALIASATPATDPNKDRNTRTRSKPGGGGGGKGVNPPRDANGRVTQWIKGMNECVCKGAGGTPVGNAEHLWRECNEKATMEKVLAMKEEKKASEKAAKKVKRADKAKAALLIERVADPETTESGEQPQFGDALSNPVVVECLEQFYTAAIARGHTSLVASHVDQSLRRQPRGPVRRRRRLPARLLDRLSRLRFGFRLRLVIIITAGPCLARHRRFRLRVLGSVRLP